MKNVKNAQRVVLIAFAFSGGAALMYEVVWTKVLSLVIGSTVYAISTMLASFMAGLSIGSFIGGRKADQIKDPLLALGLIELGIGIFGIVTLFLIGQMQPLYAFLFMTLHLSFNSFSAVQFFLCFLIMLVPTVLMGATFPIVCKALVKGEGEVGKETGYAYAVNTVGAVCGSIAAGFLFIPLVGLKSANIIAASVNILMSLILIGYSRRFGWFRSAMLIFGVSGVLAGISPYIYAFDLVYPVNYYTANRFVGMGASLMSFTGKVGVGGMTLLFSRENEYGVVQVFQNNLNGDKALMNNGKIEGGTGSDSNNQLLLTYLPIAAMPEAKSFLSIGLGSGMTLSAAIESGIKEIDCIEINPAVKEAVERHFYPNIFSQPGRPKLISADARNYLAINSKKYDIISSEPSYPTDEAVSHLFTKEFFEVVRMRLTDNGVFCQWIPFHLLGNRGVAVMIKTFTEVFPNSYIWNVFYPSNPRADDILMLGSKSKERESYDDIKNRLPFHLLTNGEEAIKPALSHSELEKLKNNAGIPVNSDDKPIIEFMAARNMLTGLRYAK